jgi:hypothetical protein
MKPFILRYGQKRSVVAFQENKGKKIEYCPQTEACILSEDRSMAIEHKHLTINATGSITTFAKGDTTTDESTDR